MHRGLEIAEIVNLIVSELDPQEQAKELASLAQTCTIFHDVALDGLWSHQEHIFNLLHCMPTDLWETNRVNFVRTLGRTPRRALVASDWPRFLKYAFRIKSLVCRDPEQEFGVPDLLQVYDALRQGVPEDLLPNLEMLYWYHVGSGYAQFINLFLGPKIASIQVIDRPIHGNSIHAALRQRSSTLVSVIFHEIPGASEMACDQRCGFIRTLTHVEYLEAGAIDSAAVRHLGSLGSLKILRATLSPSITVEGSPDGIWFPNLRSIVLNDRENLSASTTIVRRWNNHRLESFQIEIQDCWALDHVQEMYQTLADHCLIEQLNTFKLEIMRLVDEHRNIPHPSHFFIPLLRFTELRELRIRVPSGHDLDDVTISDMAHSWPRIEELIFGSAARINPRCTLLALRDLSQHCPLLEMLELTLDASSVPPQSDVVRQDHLIWFNAAFSPISNPTSVAAFLSSIFSSLQNVHNAVWTIEENDPNALQWLKVKRILTTKHIRIEEL
ncbi:hypothetical protein B0H13DRAFT_2353820 [Mycena leptocephala]|nr:hypothetical protein B0H13DRAFT_2353820 [Mycena leptocephala]